MTMFSKCKANRVSIQVEKGAESYEKGPEDDAECDADLHIGVVGCVGRKLPLLNCKCVSHAGCLWRQKWSDLCADMFPKPRRDVIQHLGAFLFLSPNPLRFPNWDIHPPVTAVGFDNFVRL
jgi:hypothetical protein